MDIKNYFQINRWLPKIHFIESIKTRTRIRSEIQFLKRQDMPIYVNLGCGQRHHPLWINLDFRGDGNRVLRWDLREGIPFSDGSCDVIYSSHVLEHLDRNTAQFFLGDCRRALKSGGILRLALPDLEGIVRSYINCLDDARKNTPGSQDRYDWSVIELLDQLVRHQSGGEMLSLWRREHIPEEAFIAHRVGDEFLRFRQNLKHVNKAASIKRWLPAIFDEISVGRFRLEGEVHRWMYDTYSITRELRKIGFAKIEPQSAACSKIINFDQFKLDADDNGRPLKPDSFYIEAVRD